MNTGKGDAQNPTRVFVPTTAAGSVLRCSGLAISRKQKQIAARPSPLALAAGPLGHPRDWPGESSHPQLLRHRTS
jgi:hypothetical protein